MAVMIPFPRRFFGLMLLLAFPASARSLGGPAGKQLGENCAQRATKVLHVAASHVPFDQWEQKC